MIQLACFMRDILFQQSYRDLTNDFTELEYIAESQKKNLKEFLSEIEKKEHSIEIPTFRFVQAEANRILLFLERQIFHIQTLITQLKLNQNGVYLNNLIAEKRKITDLLRSISGIISTIVTSTDWQSPSFGYSVFPNSGRQTGKIENGITDYKRDRHLDAQMFEQKYLREYVTGFIKLPIHVYACNSGMAAFGTILNFLLGERKIKNGILIGKNVYFQNKFLLTSIVKTKITQIQEWETKKIISFIKKKQPSIVYLDALSTSLDIAVPDIATIISALRRFSKKDVYLLIDISCVSATFQIWKHIIGKSGNVHTILFGSLNKFDQFGLDREMGGVILTYGKDTGRIFEYRKHSGTIITHNTVYAIPSPNRKLLLKRITRHGRNAQFLAQSMQEYINMHPYSAIQTVLYPGLPSHASFEWMKSTEFKGTFLTLLFKSSLKTKNKYQFFIDIVMDEAKKRNVPLVEGTSFGLNTTRIYLAAAFTLHTSPFVRISVGTETMIEIEKIADTFVVAMDRFTHSLRIKIPFL